MKTWRLAKVAIFSLFAHAAFAQQGDPKLTEIYDPKAPVVKPGDSPGAAPADAILLFDGKSLLEWTNLKGEAASWEVKDGIVTVKPGTGDIKTRRVFGDVQLHIEWRSPAVVKGEGQGRGNSGVFFHEMYEIQILDSYENETYTNGQAGSVYKQHVPLANASRKPGEWQSYDIIFTSPKFNEAGRCIQPATVTVFHNGVLIQNHVTLWGPTEYIGIPTYKKHAKGSIKLQDHGDLVSFRNIWVREL